MIYAIFAKFSQSNDISSFGQTGDYFGGILNPILTFCTVILLLKNLNHESDQAKDAREQLTESNHQKKIEKLESAIKKSTDSVFSKIADLKSFHLTSDRTDPPMSYIEFLTEMRSTGRDSEMSAILQIAHEYMFHYPLETIEKISLANKMSPHSVRDIIVLQREIHHVIKCRHILVSLIKEGILRYRAAEDTNFFVNNVRQLSLIPAWVVHDMSHHLNVLLKDFDMNAL